MMNFLLSKHSRSIFIFALLSLFLCMAAGKASAEERNPVVKIDNTSYTSSGTEVTLKLWMYNDYYSINIRDFCARFTGDVNLYIDDKEVVKLNTIWSSIADATRSTFIKIPTDNPVDINIDGINVGTALFNNLQNLQTCPDNSDTTEKNWWTVDLKLSFNKSFSYYGHKITVKGKWQDQGSGSLVTKDVVLDNTINGFVRPINLKAQPSGSNMVFSWEQEGYNPSASTDGKWIVYKREGDNNVKLGKAAANEHSLSIEKKQYSCSKDYIMTFLPNVCEGEETVCGLTTTFTATGHQINDDDICQICGHSFFRYHTSNGNIVDISNKDFGANVVSHEVINHEVINCECVIEFDAPITRIPAQAFSNSKIFGDLVIPNSVTTIDDYAFSNCGGLNGSLTLSNSLKTIGTSAFYWCTELKGNLTLPDSVTTIGDNAFCYCHKFTGNLTIPNSVTTIGYGAFSNCSGFTGNLTIPNSVTTIGNGAFQKCFRFTGNLTLPNSVTTIGEYAFNECSGFTNLKLSEKLSIIPLEAFSGCTNISGELVIPASVKEIGREAFSNCSGFTGNLTIPNSVTTIGESAFYKCTGFTGKLTIPNSVTTIGKMAFYECSGFTGDLTIPNSVTTIETSTFEYCTGFKGKLTIPNSVTTIGEHAFNECSGFTGNLTIPNSVTTIGEHAFNECSGFTGNLTIPNSVTTIGHLAFGACSGFTGDVSLPKSLEILGSTSFKACKKIKTIKFQSLPTVLKGSLDDYKAIVSLSDDSYISPEVSGTVNEISYTRQISNNWGTLVLPYPLKLTGSEPYRLYNIETVSDDELVLKQLDGEVASGTPCVVKRKGSEAELTFSANNAELNMAINDQPMDGMNFSGTYWTKDVNNGYIIAKDCFWNVAELNKSDLVKGVKVKPFRAWLDGTSPNGASQLSICVSDTATGIGAAGTIDVLNDTATEYYDLSGKRLDEPQRGVNIVRMKSGKTKKIIIK
ncbi:leucine-rich repeat domain-containing protein [uncultured Prevotella sp.]|uniref:leucine-rich repeat domain-containing protein n=1 Tax=uncultured Prevotella sp. TaxID=159272 RepID=UPI0027E2C840|nr:leucine-rich repeat domain-containing protein [uncultured Prevotella sp.]